MAHRGGRERSRRAVVSGLDAFDRGGRARSPSTIAAIVGIVVAAFNLRIAVVAVGPMLEDIRRDTGMSSAVAGVLTTIPFVCMGAFAMAGEPVIRRVGREHAVTAALALIAGGTVLRAAMSTPALLLVTTVPTGIGIAVANIALPAVIKDRFPHRPGALTGAYVASLSVGSAAITAGIVPLADVLGGWDAALAVSAAPAVLAVAVWLVTRAGRDAGNMTDHAPTHGWRPTRPAVMIGLVFGFQSICYAAMVSWAPAVFSDAGWSESRAALVTAVIPLVTIPAGLLAPALSDGRDRRTWVLCAAAIQTVGMLAVALTPGSAPWLWITLFGIGNGAVFALALTLPLDFGTTPSEVAWITSWVLFIGFTMSALSPVLVGALRDVTGGFALPVGLVGALGFSAGIVAMKLREPEHPQHAAP